MPDRQLISVVIPLYNEANNVRPLYDALGSVFASLDVEHEFIFVDDGSTDGTTAALGEIAHADPSARVIELSRNFGKEIAVTAGVRAAKGDACIIMDADLQHPPALIPEFIRRWRGGAEVVIGVREGGAGGFLRRVCSRAYYAILGAISETRVIPNATDFRLLDRAVIDQFNRFTEKSRMNRALIDWLGFRREYVTFAAPPRADGKSRYGTVRLVRLAVSSIVSHSLFPLKFAGYLGVSITLVSGALGAFIFVEKYVLADPLELNISGPAILAVINLFLVGIVLTCLGLIALYIANIHGEVTGRPLYVVRSRRNFPSE